MDLMSASSKNVPKMSLTSMDIKDNYFVVKTGLLYNYYPIKVKAYSETDNIIRFEKSPPVLMEGIVIVGKKPYHVTPEDLMRQIIRKSREVALPKREKLNGKSRTDSTSSVRETVQHSVEHGAVSKAEMEVIQDADIAWEEQIGALLDIISEKEGIEYEVQDLTQSR